MDTIRGSGGTHLERQVMGREVVVADTEGRLDFPCEQVFCGELNGRRRKRALLKVIGDGRPAQAARPYALAPL